MNETCFFASQKPDLDLILEGYSSVRNMISKKFKARHFELQILRHGINYGDLDDIMNGLSMIYHLKFHSLFLL